MLRRLLTPSTLSLALALIAAAGPVSGVSAQEAPAAASAAADVAAGLDPADRRLVDSLLGAIPDHRFERLRVGSRPIRRDSAALDYLRRRGRAEGHCTAEAFANDMLGKLERNAADFDDAVAFHEAARAIAEACDDTTMVATALNGIGVVYRRQDKITLALDAHTAALRIADAHPRPPGGLTYAIGVALNSLGNIYLTLEQWGDAEREFARSLRVQDSIGNALGVAINNQNLGYAARGRGDLAAALAYFEASQDINEQIGSDFGLVLNYIAIADLYSLTGREREGLAILERALPMAEAIGDPYHTAHANIVMGAAHTRLRNADRAEPYLRRGLDLARAGEHLQHEVRALRLLSTVDSLRGDYRAALEYYQRAETAEERLLNRNTRRFVGDLSTKLTAERQRAEIEQLAQENALVRERSRRDRIVLLAVLGTVLFAAVLLVVLYRQRRIIETRDLAHLEQQRLASQMNPHFLFNALNSIKAFLIDNEREAAIRYLDTFAQLVRRILKSSIDETVTLREELENCRLYIRIENARLNHEVDYAMDVDPRVDLDAVQVPPMLLQPFLENAFWHGLQPKRGDKRLDIYVALQDARRGELGRDRAAAEGPDVVVVDDDDPSAARVRITIADNGVGRAAAERAKANRVRPRKSVGIDITRRRLEVFAKQAGTRATFRTLDLIAPDGEALGTEVVLEVG